MENKTNLQKNTYKTKLLQPITLQTYKTKTIICGEFIRHYIYPKTMFRGYNSISPSKKLDDTRKTLVKPVEAKTSPLTGQNSSTDLPKQPKLKSNYSISRSRDNLFNTIQTNLTQYSKLLTLTTRQTTLDRQTFLKYFKRFQTRFKTKFKIDLKYIGILERQKKRGQLENNAGSLHIHMIIFVDDYLPFQKLKEIWTDIGSLDIKKVQNKDLAIYLAKYLTKDKTNSIHQTFEKTIFKSKNLKKPKIIFDSTCSSTGLFNKHGELITSKYLFQIYSSKYLLYETDLHVFYKEFSPYKKTKKINI